MYEHPPDSGHCVELYVRSLAPGPAHGLQDALIARLEELVDRGTLEGMQLYVWGDSVCPESAAAGTAAGEFVLDRVNTFVAWARENGFTPRSCLRVTDVNSTLAEVEYTAIKFPQMLLAEFDDGELLFLSPCSDTDHDIGVQDHLSALADEELPVPGVTPQVVTTPDPDDARGQPPDLREALDVGEPAGIGVSARPATGDNGNTTR